jgi:hypothetical protein
VEVDDYGAIGTKKSPGILQKNRIEDKERVDGT